MKKESPRIFYGWFVVGGLFLSAAFGPTSRYILAGLAPFIMKDPGWSRHTIGLAFTLHFWAYALMAIITGRLIDRVGGRAVIFYGGALILIGLFLLSMLHQVWQLYLVFGLLLAAGVSMTHFVPNTALARKWFIRKAGLATGLVTVGTVAGLAIILPVATRLSAQIGWRNTSRLCALAFGSIIMLSGLLLIRNTPESMGLYPDGKQPIKALQANPELRSFTDQPTTFSEWTTGKAMITRNFLYFFIAFSIMGIPVQGVLTHITLWGVDLGFSAANSGIMMAALTVPSVPSRILAGWLGDRFGKKNMLILFNIYSVGVWLFGWFFITNSSHYFIFIILIGLAYGAPFSLFTPFLGDLFGRKIVGSLMGILILGHGIIGGTGPYLWGWIADRMGSYLINCPISAICYTIVTVFLFLVRTPGNPLINGQASGTLRGPNII